MVPTPAASSSELYLLRKETSLPGNGQPSSCHACMSISTGRSLDDLSTEENHDSPRTNLRFHFTNDRCSTMIRFSMSQYFINIPAIPATLLLSLPLPLSNLNFSPPLALVPVPLPFPSVPSNPTNVLPRLAVPTEHAASIAPTGNHSPSLTRQAGPCVTASTLCPAGLIANAP